MNFADFLIRQLTFEVRYDDSHLIWDVAGRITRELLDIWPGLKLEEGKPNQQVLKGQKLQVQTGIRTSHVMLFHPKTVVQHSEQIASTLKVWTSFLELNKLTRIGTRTIFTKEYKSEEEADKAVVELNLVRVPEGPVFNCHSGPTQMGLNVRWNDDLTTTYLSIGSERRVYEIDGPADFYDEAKKVTKNACLIDIDRATLKPLELSKFDVRQWLEGVQHVQSRDIPKFLAIGK